MKQKKYVNYNSLFFVSFKVLMHRPWHNAQAIALTCAITHANQEKGGLWGQWKAHPKYKAVWADIACTKFSKACPEFILIDITELILNWFF